MTEFAQSQPYGLETLLADRYRILEYIGSGGMGWVLRVADTRLNDEVFALKLLYPHLLQNETSLARFRTEVLISRRLLHPNIVKTYAFTSHGSDAHFITMEYVAGISLSQALKEQAADFSSCLQLLYELSAGMSQAHSQGVIHKDLKPDNILLQNDGRVKILDFGISELLSENNKGQAGTQMLGTPQYMSPEQFRTEALDTRTDVYSFGLIAYEIACRRPPFTESSFFALAQKHLNEKAPPLTTLNPQLPQWFAEFVQTCLEKDPQKRFQDAQQLESILQPHAPDPGINDEKSSLSRIHLEMTRPQIESKFKNAPIEQRKIFRILSRLSAYALIPSVLLLLFGFNEQVKLGALFSTFLLLDILIALRTRTWFRVVNTFVVAVATVLFLAQVNPATRKRAITASVQLERFIGTEIALNRWLFGYDFDSFDPLLPISLIRNNFKDGEWIIRKSGIDYDIYEDNGRHLLHIIAREGSAHQAGRFLATGLNPNILDADQRTPLHDAVEYRDELELSNMFLEHGSNPSAVDSSGKTPMWYAAQRGNLQLMKVIARYRAPIDQELVIDGRKNSALHLAVNRVPLSDFKLICAHLQKPDVQDYEGKTALHALVLQEALDRQRLAKAGFLIERGASIHIKDNSGNTPLDYAKARNDEEMLAVLLTRAEKAQRLRFS